MTKRPPPVPDPNPLSVNMRANLTRREEAGPKVTLPRVRWLERDIDEKQPDSAPQFAPGGGSGGRASPDRAEDENALETKFMEIRRMNKTGRYTRDAKVTFTDDQFARIKQAVKLSGKPFTEWARPVLLAAAQEQIREHRERELAAAE